VFKRLDEVGKTWRAMRLDADQLVSCGATRNPNGVVLLGGDKDVHTADQIWQLLFSSDLESNVITSGSVEKVGDGCDLPVGKKEAKRADDLITDHAYSILQVHEVAGFKLMQLRVCLWLALVWRAWEAPHAAVSIGSPCLGVCTHFDPIAARCRRPPACQFLCRGPWAARHASGETVAAPSSS
jgi:hypothetical protein